MTIYSKACVNICKIPENQITGGNEMNERENQVIWKISKQVLHGLLEIHHGSIACHNYLHFC